MSQLPAPGMIVRPSKPTLDIFGVLLIIATGIVIAAMIYVIWKSSVMYGAALPAGGDA